MFLRACHIVTTVPVVRDFRQARDRNLGRLNANRYGLNTTAEYRPKWVADLPHTKRKEHSV